MAKKPRKSKADRTEELRQHHWAQLQASPKEEPVVSVDKDGIITAHTKADVWPYDDVNTAVQVNTPYGYILVLVQRYDRPQ